MLVIHAETIHELPTLLPIRFLMADFRMEVNIMDECCASHKILITVSSVLPALLLIVSQIFELSIFFQNTI